MAEIPRAALDEYTRQVNAVSADAQEKVLRVLERVEWTDENIADCRAIVSEAVRSVCDAYGMAAAQASADFYDAARELSIGEPLGAVPDPGYNPDATDGAIRAFAQDIVDGKPVSIFNSKVLDRVDYEMKRSSAHSIIANAKRDPKKPRWARVPSGGETCPFCLMLASRGFAYRSLDAAEHCHPDCDCRVIQGYRGMSVEGYDPEALYSDYLDGAFGTFANKRRGGSRGGRIPDREAYKIMGEWKDRLAKAKTIDELYDVGSECEKWLKETSFRGKGTNDTVLAILRGAASRRHGELSVGGHPGIVTYTKPRSELLEHERAGVDWLAKRGYDIETIPEIGDAAANLDIRMDGEDWEMKNVTNADSSVSNQLKRARVKWYKLGSDDPARCVITCEGCDDDFERVLESVRSRKRNGERIVVISQDGEIIEA